MARKTSIYVDEASDTIVTDRDSERAPEIRRHGRRSMIFRELLRRYDEICRSDIPDLSEAEWSLLIRIGESWGAKEDVDSGVRIGRLLTTASENKQLIKKLIEFGQAQRIAIVDYIERYWTARARSGTPPSLPGRDGTLESPADRAGGRK